MVTGLLASLVFSGCAAPRAAQAVASPATAVVVAPVLNLSNSSDWDPLKVTDIVASELQSFPDVVVVPVNRTLAALSLTGKTIVETPQDALDLAAALGADATLVTAITEYDAYYPPRLGVVMQWYARRPEEPRAGLDPVAASRQAADIGPPPTPPGETQPAVQVQRVYDAAHAAVLDDVRAYARRRGGHGSPYGWRLYVKSQEHFIRYCCWASIRSMLLAEEPARTESPADEAR